MSQAVQNEKENTMKRMTRWFDNFIVLLFLIFSNYLSAEMVPLMVPSFDPASNKFTGKSVITDSIDNQAPGQQFRDRTYFYDFAIDASGKAYVLYAQPKPLTLNSALPMNNELEKTDIILAVENETGWTKQILTTEGVYQPAALQIDIDSKNIMHLIYIRKLTKVFNNVPTVVDYLIYRKIENGVVSNEIEVGDVDRVPINDAGLGGWRTRMAIAPDDSVYMIREGGNQSLTTPQLKLLAPDGQGNWTAQVISGLPDVNWYRIGEFLIDGIGRPHIIFADYAYNNLALTYTASSFANLDHLGFHNLWYAGSESLNGLGWNSTHLDETPNSNEPALYNFQFWPDLSLDENNNPAVATWLWRVNTQFPGYGSSTVFFQRSNQGNWSNHRTTRTFDNVTFRPNGELAGMGPGLVKDALGWHGVWDNSHPRPFEHSFLRGGTIYRFSPDGVNWSSYQPIAEFSVEGYCIVEIDKQNRLNVLVLGDHTDTQLYFLRYQLPGNNVMEAFSDRRFYYKGESVTLHGRVHPGAEGDFYVAAISQARPEINQPAEIWQMTSNLTWEKISDLNQLRPLLTLNPGAGIHFNQAIGVIGPNQPPFDKNDTNYTLYSLVTKAGTTVFENQWVTPLFARELTVNLTLP